MWEVVVLFIDIGGIGDNHCEIMWEVVVLFIDIGGIGDNHCEIMWEDENIRII
jgi:hypothetical protein